jgi:hypothetical protein
MGAGVLAVLVVWDLDFVEGLVEYWMGHFGGL